MSEEQFLPAWSEPFVGDDLSGLIRSVRLDQIDRTWAFDGATGRGVTVAVIDMPNQGERGLGTQAKLG